MEYNINYSKFDKKNRRVEESILSIANGYLGMRGSFEEGYCADIDGLEGTYLNAFYDYFDIQYAAKYTGYPDLYQRIMPLINIQNIEIFINEERYLFNDELVSEYNTNLDLNTGELTREYTYKIKDDYIKFKFKKFLSQKNYELFLQDINIEFNFSVEKNIKIKFPLIFKELDIDKGVPNDPRNNFKGKEVYNLVSKFSENNLQAITYETLRSHKKYCYATQIDGLQNFNISNDEEGIVFEKQITKEKVLINKTSVMYDDNFFDVNTDSAIKKLNNYLENNYAEHLNQNISFFKKFWKNAHSFFGENNKDLELPNNFNMFQLYTNIGKLKWTNVAAKGLTGEGYAGHYFWDSEIYIAIALTLFDPELSKSMLMFRYNTLPQARERAKLLAHPKGALYPWRTINGEETSTYYPAGTAQYHINGDIAFTIVNYFKSTKDYNFLFNYGLDILIETARVWEDKISVFENLAHINSVTGPDEYQIIVNDDYWTNCVAELNLQWAVKTLDMLKNKDKNLYDKKMHELKITNNEKNTWNTLSKIIYHPYDAKMDINPQHDNFLKRKKVNREYIDEHKPFLRKLHPLSINTLQVTKQADVVLANMFFYNKNNIKTMLNNWNFYDATDTADSSLSKCIYAIMAARLRINDYGFEYFKNSINLDLYDEQKNTDRGLHMANMGGVRMFVIYGLLGINIEEEFLEINPCYNDKLNNYSININYQETLINFNFNKNILIIKNMNDNNKNIDIKYKGKIFNLKTELEFEIYE